MQGVIPPLLNTHISQGYFYIDLKEGKFEKQAWTRKCLTIYWKLFCIKQLMISLLRVYTLQGFHSKVIS